MKLRSIILNTMLLAAILPVAAQAPDSTTALTPFTTIGQKRVLPRVTTKIHLMTRSYGDSIVLRWVAEDFTSYNYLARLGVNVLRIPRVKADGTPIVGEKVDTLAYELRPKTLEQFRSSYAPNDSNADIAMGLLYGEKENLHPNNQGFADKTQNESSDQDIAYGFAMLVADWRADLARDLAVRLTDRNVEPGATYDYIVQPTVWENNGRLIFEPGVAEEVKNVPYRPEPNVPQMVDSLSNPGTLMLGWWDKDHSSFEIERRHTMTLDGRRVDGQWVRVTRKPYVPMIQQPEGEGYCVIHDSVPELGMWNYRLMGHDPFAELTPPTEHSVFVRDVQPPVPANIKYIVIERPDDDDPMSSVIAHVVWEKDTLESDFAGYRVFYRPMHDGEGGLWQAMNFDLLAPTDTLLSIDMTGKRTGMMYISAYDDSGNESKSFMQQIRLTDFKAPQVPSNLRADVRKIDLERDSTVLASKWAFIDLYWQPAAEDDDIDYFDIAWANDTTHNFLIRNQGGIRQTTYTDSVALNANQRYIYYKVRAIDWSTNVGQWSDWIQVERPHITPPTQPHLGESSHDELMGMHMEWIVGKDADMREHTLYRRLGENGTPEVVGTWNADSVKAHDGLIVVDDNPPFSPRERYYYWMSSTNASPFVANSLAVSWRHTGPRMFDLNISLMGTYDVSEQCTVLDWGVDESKLPDGDWYWAIFRRGPGQKSHSYYMAAPKEDRSYIEHTLKPGEEASYYVRLQFGDGRRSKDSEPVTVSVPKNE